VAIYILRRLLQIPLPLLAVSVVVFVALRATGDPVDLLLGLEATAEQRAALRERDRRPAGRQYGRFLAHAVKEISERRSVQATGALVVDRMPNALIAVGLALAVMAGIVSVCGRGAAWIPARPVAGQRGRSRLSSKLLVGILLIVLFAVSSTGCRPPARAAGSTSSCRA
jgi:ABC-type dipeptide/oligopeptide/nickel transport system permease component